MVGFGSASVRRFLLLLLLIPMGSALGAEPANCAPGYHCVEPTYVYGFSPQVQGDDFTFKAYPSPAAACAGANRTLPKAQQVPTDSGIVYSDVVFSNCTPSDDRCACDRTVVLTGQKDRGLYTTYVIPGPQCPADMDYIGGNINVCQSRTQVNCPVQPLAPITDPLAQNNESGYYSTHPDLERVTEPTRIGANCIVSAAPSFSAIARVTSGFRPTTYQAHLREVWDKWHLLATNTSPQCAAVKAAIKAEFDKHKLVHEPAVVSNHTNGTAFDASVQPNTAAMRATLAQQCNLKQPVPNDRVHYEPK